MRERRAVVVEQSGTTRDRVEAVVSVEGYKVRIVDTGGNPFKIVADALNPKFMIRLCKPHEK